MSYSIPTLPVAVLQELEPSRAWLIDRLPSHTETLELSARTTGQWYRTRYALVHRAGQRSETWLLAAPLHPGEGLTILDDITCCQRMVSEITGAERPGWTYSQLSRTLNKWHGIHQPVLPDPNPLLRRGQYHYQQCIPVTVPEAYYYDMRSAYWQAASRAPSPLVTVGADGTLKWHSISPTQEQRWESLKDAAGQPQYKRLRLAFIGSSMAGWDRHPTSWTAFRVYQAGRVEAGQHVHGPLQPLACVAIRTVYELTQIQAQQAQTIYANIDCVITRRREPMAFWTHWGIQHSLKAHGEGDIWALGARRVGHDYTVPYEWMREHNVSVPHAPVVIRKPRIHEQVLRAC